MRRREFITLIGSATAGISFSWPPAARTQNAMPVIGYLGPSSFEREAGRSLFNFKKGLAETGYVEERNITIEYRFADDHYAFSALVHDRVEALQIGVDPLFGNHIDQLVALATRHKIPTIYPWREFTAAGGLMKLRSQHP